MSKTIDNRPLRLAILQRVCPGYRSALFTGLSSEPGLNALLLIGDDIPKSKVKSAPTLEGITHLKLKTRFLHFGTRVLPWHVGLVGELKRFDPDVILCEGESHFLGYLQAIFYKYFHKRRVGLMHWCFISLPGWPSLEGGTYRVWIKRLFRRFFDAFVVYSSFSRDCLVKLGQPREKAFVATNVGDVRKFLAMSDALRLSQGEAREKLGIPDRFTAIYVGTLDENKRPDLLLDMAKALDRGSYNFALLGGGPMLEGLQQRALSENLTNVHIPGRIADQLALWYRAADALLIPGRGGIVMSEALAFGVPVVVHEADGTEYDLVEDKVTGIRLKGAGLRDFTDAVEFLRNDPPLRKSMAEAGRRLVETRFTTSNMVGEIVKAARYAKESTGAKAVKGNQG